MNAQRLGWLIRRSVDRLRLDLAGLTVLTEAASGPFVVTPVLARLAGADHVVAFARDSDYATAAEVADATWSLARELGVTSGLAIVPRDTGRFAEADIVTNLGAVRPIDALCVDAMKPTASVSLMHEAWEARPGDVDYVRCHERGIPVLGTDEDHPLVDVFAHSGWLGVQLLQEAGVELHGASVVVVGADKFARVVSGHLARCGVDVRRVDRLTAGEGAAVVASADAVVVADYTRPDVVIGDACGDVPADVSAQELAALAPHLTVVLFAGRIDHHAVAAAGLTVHPALTLPSHRMARTLGHLGPRPVVDLHAAGLKVGELAQRGRMDVPPFVGLAQPVGVPVPLL